MTRTILIYALVLVAAAVALEWLEYRYLLRSVPLAGVIAVIAVAFAALGIWVGLRLSRRHAPGPFEVNRAALASLGISEREYAVLERLAAGRSNKEIARELSISPNTVKTHVANLYTKLEVSKRTEAANVARELGLIA
ncbi:MAG: response regulator transcription factor [Wenzhouxiangellaceae bacterium]